MISKRSFMALVLVAVALVGVTSFTAMAGEGDGCEKAAGCEGEKKACPSETVGDETAKSCDGEKAAGCEGEAKASCGGEAKSWADCPITGRGSPDQMIAFFEKLAGGKDCDKEGLKSAFEIVKETLKERETEIAAKAETHQKAMIRLALRGESTDEAVAALASLEGERLKARLAFFDGLLGVMPEEMGAKARQMISDHIAVADAEAKGTSSCCEKKVADAARKGEDAPACCAEAVKSGKKGPGCAEGETEGCEKKDEKPVQHP